MAQVTTCEFQNVQLLVKRKNAILDDPWPRSSLLHAPSWLAAAAHVRCVRGSARPQARRRFLQGVENFFRK
jgi:hypothetical protein